MTEMKRIFHCTATLPYGKAGISDVMTQSFPAGAHDAARNFIGLHYPNYLSGMCEVREGRLERRLATSENFTREAWEDAELWKVWRVEAYSDGSAIVVWVKERLK
jgi:hypothetical protein